MLTWNHVYKAVLEVITYVNMELCVQVITYVNMESCVQGCITSDNIC
jgi:hypothetical protein